jgi:hypothetical protein
LKFLTKAAPQKIAFTSETSNAPPGRCDNPDIRFQPRLPVPHALVPRKNPSERPFGELFAFRISRRSARRSQRHPRLITTNLRNKNSPFLITANHPDSTFQTRTPRRTHPFLTLAGPRQPRLAGHPPRAATRLETALHSGEINGPGLSDCHPAHHILPAPLALQPWQLILATSPAMRQTPILARKDDPLLKWDMITLLL